MTRYSAIGYAVLFVAILFAVFSFNNEAADRSATMAPDLQLSPRP